MREGERDRVVCFARASCAAILVLLLCASFAWADDTEAFLGSWSTVYGMLHIRQDSDAVRGDYPNGTLTGTVRGRRLDYWWTEDNSSGSGSFEITPQGDRIKGAWIYADGSGGGDWEGFRPADSRAYTTDRSDQTEDSAARAERLYLQGAQALVGGRLEEAAQRFAAAYALIEQAPGDTRPQLAAIESSLSLLERSRNNLSRARDHARLARDLFISLNGPVDTQVMLSHISVGDFDRHLGRPRDAIPSYREALAAAQALSGPRSRDCMLIENRLGLAYDDLSLHDSALHHYRASLALMESREEDMRYDRAVVSSNIGSTVYALGRAGEALEMHEAALRLLREARGDTSVDLGSAHHNIATDLFALGRYAEAERHYRQAIKKLETHPAELRRLLGTTGQLGSLLAVMGDYGEAERLCRSSLDHRVALFGETHPAVSQSWNQLGLIVQYRGETSAAITCFTRFLEITRALYDPGHPEEGIALNNLATAWHDARRLDEAESAYRAVLEIRTHGATEVDPRTATNYVNLGKVLLDRGKLEEAGACYDSALWLMQRSRYDRHPDLSTVHDHRAALARRRGDTAQWIAGLESSVAAARLLDEPWNRRAGTLMPAPIIVYRLYMLSWAHASDRTVARTVALGRGISIMDTALSLLERMRRNVSSSSREFHEQELRELPGWMLEMQTELESAGGGRDEERSLRAIEMASAWSFLEQLAAGRSSTVLDLPTDIGREEAELSFRIASLARRAGEAAADRERIELEDRFDELVVRIEEVAPRYAAWRHPRPVRLSRLRQALRPTEAALSFVVTKEGVFGLLVTSDTSRLRRVGSEVVVTKEVEAARATMTATSAPRRDRSGVRRGESGMESGAVRAADTALYQRLLGPFEDLFAGRRLVIAPGGPLEQISFAALRTPRATWLIDEHEIAVTPSLSIFTLLRETPREPPTDRLLALGNPVYSGPVDPAAARSRTRFGAGERSGWTPLPGTAIEVRAIARNFAPESRVVLTGLAASEAMLTADTLARFGMLHFACHGALEAGPGAEPALVLSQSGNVPPADGFLSLSEIVERPHRSRLTVLSACNSGVAGAKRPRTGVSSLARAFLLAGSEAVLVSLWPVSDEATARLMHEVYAGLRAEGLPAAAALRAASLRLRAQPRTSLPVTWAPFIVVGE